MTNWMKSIEGIPDVVASMFCENEINGLELLALDRDGLKDIGVTRAGTICLLLKEIKTLEQKSQDVSTLIEHSPSDVRHLSLTSIVLSPPLSLTSH